MRVGNGADQDVVPVYPHATLRNLLVIRSCHFAKFPKLTEPLIHMKRSTERFLTTHTGSLPRPDDLVRMMYAKEEGVPVDGAALATRVRSAVREVVQRQRNAGVDIVNDGELSKPSYATYIKDRLSGFGGTGNTFAYQDLAEFPRLAQRVLSDPLRPPRN